MPDRERALALLEEYTKNDSLIKHALAVEAAMRHYARRFGEDESLWGVVGLLHDFDYDRYPSLDDHPFKGAEILRSLGYDELLVRAILSHADHTGVTRESALEKTLFAVDELCGLLTAVALVRPSKRIADVAVKSVKKKMKDKGFARSVNRDDIRRGPESLGVELDEHIANVLDAMRGVSDALGL
ncbi:MAG: HD domain-containing protein [Candidatus Krumholzibacteriia bacterium]